MDGELKVELVAPKASDIQELSWYFLNSLRSHSPELAQALEDRVRDRTPKDSGALRESVTGKGYPGAVSGKRAVNLVQLYAEDGPQLAEWGRVYVGYQEYLPLGQSTYTPQKAQMFYRVGTEDLGLIEQWAQDALDGANEALHLDSETTEPA